MMVTLSYRVLCWSMTSLIRSEKKNGYKLEDGEAHVIWPVICFTEKDWIQ